MRFVIESDYLDIGEESPEIVRRVITSDTIDTAGDFSYSFSIPITAKNKSLLKLNVNESAKLIGRKIDCNVEIEGVPIHRGYLRIDRVTTSIDLSFFSGNTDWFADLEDRQISELDMSYYSVGLANISPSPVVSGSWTNTEGITFPFLDRGRLKNWSVPRVDTEDFMPMVFVKTVMRYIFNNMNIKLTGELISDSVYNSLTVGIDDQFDPDASWIDARSCFVGKLSQSINTTPALITFDQESYPYYDGISNRFDSNRYTADLNLSGIASVEFELAASVDYVIELRKNGSVLHTITSTGDSVSIAFNDNNVVALDALDYIEVWMYTASGSTTINEGSFTFSMRRFNRTYPQFLIGNMLQSDFVRGIFRMLNVIASYNKETRTLTANLFKNVQSSEQDLSPYISEYELDFTEVLEGISKRNLFVFQDGADSEIEDYNERNEVPYAGGVIEPDNDFLTGTSDFDVPFASSFGYYNNMFQVNLSGIGYYNFEDSSDGVSILSVTDDGGEALFHTDGNHGFDALDYVRITDTGTGNYLGVGRIQSVPNTNEFKIQNLDFISDTTGFVVATALRSTRTGNIHIGITIPNMLVSDFSRKSTLNYSGGIHSRVAYFYFLKSDLGLPIDKFRDSVAFGNPGIQFRGNTLLDKYYSEQQKFFNDPVKVKSIMHIPFTLFNRMDLTKSFRIKTEEMNVKCVVSNIDNYLGSDLPCDVHLIKLS